MNTMTSKHVIARIWLNEKGTNQYETQASQARCGQNVQDIQTSLRRKSDISVLGLGDD